MKKFFSAAMGGALVNLWLIIFAGVSQAAPVNYIEMTVTGTIQSQLAPDKISDSAWGAAFGQQFTWTFTAPGPYYATFPVIFGNSSFSLNGNNVSAGSEYRSEDVLGRPYWNYPASRSYSSFRSPPYQSSFVAALDAPLPFNGGGDFGTIRLTLGRYQGGHNPIWRQSYTSFDRLDVNRYQNPSLLLSMAVFENRDREPRYFNKYAYASIDTLSISTPYGLFAPVPLPASASLLLFGIAGFAALRRRKPAA